MRDTPRHRLHRLILTLIVGAALLLSAFAHRMPSSQDLALSGYVLAGGDLNDICGDSGDMKMTASGCDACRLVGGAVLAEPVLCPVAVERVIAATVLIPSETHAARVPRDPALGERAPPLA